MLKLLKLFMYKKLYNMSWEHVNEFEIKLMKRKSKTTLKIVVTNVFLLKWFEKIWNWFLLEFLKYKPSHNITNCIYFYTRFIKLSRIFKIKQSFKGLMSSSIGIIGWSVDMRTLPTSCSNWNLNVINKNLNFNVLTGKYIWQ